MMVDNRAGKMLLVSEDFIYGSIDADILDETHAQWLYIGEDGKTYNLYTDTSYAYTYLKFKAGLHSLVTGLKYSDNVIVVYREEYSDFNVFGIRGMDR